MINKLQTSYLVFFLLIQLSNISYASDVAELKFKDVFNTMKSCIEKYDFKGIISPNFYDRTEKIADFDFGNLLPIKNKINDLDYYKVYYKNNKIAKISRFNSENRSLNYSFLILDSKDFCFLILAENTLEDSRRDAILDKVIIHNKKNKYNFLVSFIDLFDYDQDENNHIYYFLNSKVKSKDITRMYYLDDKLKAKTRLNFRENKLFSFSKVSKKEGVYYEEMQNYFTHKKYCNLKYVPYNFFIDYLKNGSTVHEYRYKMTVKPNQNKGLPLWFSGNWYE